MPFPPPPRKVGLAFGGHLALGAPPPPRQLSRDAGWEGLAPRCAPRGAGSSGPHSAGTSGPASCVSHARG